MNIDQIMSRNPVCCTPDTKLQEVARLMCEHDCGEIPIVNDQTSRHVIGVITDRDITCRAVARGRNPLELTAKECMTTSVETVNEGMSLEECCRLMEDKQIRRVPVVANGGTCIGIVSQADIARRAPSTKTAEVVAEISRPAARAS
jgi:CBS domain-containing protein